MTEPRWPADPCVSPSLAQLMAMAAAMNLAVVPVACVMAVSPERVRAGDFGDQDIVDHYLASAPDQLVLARVDHWHPLSPEDDLVQSLPGVASVPDDYLFFMCCGQGLVPARADGRGFLVN